MKFLFKILPLSFLMPLMAFAQGNVGNFQGLNTFINQVLKFMNQVLVPAIIALAIFIFIWGMFKTFILGGHNEEKQEEGKKLMMYAIAGFVLILSIGGIVNLLAGSLGFTNSPIIPPSILPPGR